MKKVLCYIEHQRLGSLTQRMIFQCSAGHARRSSPSIRTGHIMGNGSRRAFLATKCLRANETPSSRYVRWRSAGNSTCCRSLHWTQRGRNALSREMVHRAQHRGLEHESGNTILARIIDRLEVDRNHHLRRSLRGPGTGRHIISNIPTELRRFAHGYLSALHGKRQIEKEYFRALQRK